MLEGITAPIMALNPGQKTPPAAPSRPSAQLAQRPGGHVRGGGEREQDVADHLGRHAGQDDPPRAQSVDHGPVRSDDDHADDGRNGQQASGALDGEPAHLVEVDEAEWQDQPGAKRLDGDRGQQERQVAPEGCQ
jgi:hypothetical protein